MTDLPPPGPPAGEPWSPPPLTSPPPAPTPPAPAPEAPWTAASPGASPPYPPPGAPPADGGYGRPPPPPAFPPPGYGYGTGPTAGYGYGYGYQAPRRTNGNAIASLVCGICAFVVCPVVAVAGLVTGLRARRQIRESDGREDGDGLAIAGLIVSGLGLLYLVAMVVVFAFLITVASRFPTTPNDPYPTYPPYTTTTTFG